MWIVIWRDILSKSQRKSNKISTYLINIQLVYSKLNWNFQNWNIEIWKRFIELRVLLEMFVSSKRKPRILKCSFAFTSRKAKAKFLKLLWQQAFTSRKAKAKFLKLLWQQTSKMWGVIRKWKWSNTLKFSELKVE